MLAVILFCIPLSLITTLGLYCFDVRFLTQPIIKRGRRRA